MTEIQGKSILVRVSARFELARVRVIGSQLYISPRLGESGIREIYAYGAYGIRNPGLWNPENNSRNPESHQRLVSGVQNPLTKNPESTAWNPESKSLGFPYI